MYKCVLDDYNIRKLKTNTYSGRMHYILTRTVKQITNIIRKKNLI